MCAGIAGYVALQGLLLGLCLHLTGAGCAWPEVVAAFAVERALTIVPITPGGVGVADLGLVGVLLAFGGDPTGVAAAAVLYRAFVFAVEIPAGSGALGVWLLGQRWAARRRLLAPRPRPASAPQSRVAHVTDVFLPRVGGIETHVDDLARHQRAQGMQADVLTPPRADRLGQGSEPAWVRRMPLAQARDAVAAYDVVHVHVSVFSPYGLGVARAAIRAGVPVLVTVHSMWRGTGGLLRVAALAGLHRWPVAWSAVSRAAADSAGRALRCVEVAVLPNTIDVESWRPAPGETEQEGDGDPVRIVSVMRLTSRKRPLQLLRMFARARRCAGPGLHLTIVGDGPLRPRVERYVRRNDLEEFVRLVGRLPRGRVHAELAAASVYVAPAPNESFGIAALEARCAGLPVVAHRRSGVTEFVRDRVEGLLVDSDAEMAGALTELVRDRDLRGRITRHNHEVAPELGWSEVLRRTAELYRVAAHRAALAGSGVPDTRLVAVGA
jgi:glycosyltransferase involved in cell wall biosynthesis